MPIAFTRWLGRRRRQLLLSQAMVMAGLVGMAFNDPRVASLAHDGLLSCSIHGHAGCC